MATTHSCNEGKDGIWWETQDARRLDNTIKKQHTAAITARKKECTITAEMYT